MKQFFMTPTREISVGELLETNLPQPISCRDVLKSGGVWLNQKRILNPNQILSLKDTLLVYTDKYQSIEYRLKTEQVVHETDDFLVVFKPALINISPDRLSITNHLTFGVNAYLKQQGITYESTPINRLDKPVQGLVLYPKNKVAERNLFYKMRHHEIKKLYLAYVEGTGHISHLKIEDPLGFKKAAFVSESGKEAVTRIRKCASYERYELYAAVPITGRQHQIRCHLAHRVAPIIGDQQYGSKERERGVALISAGLNFSLNDTRYRIRLPKTLIFLKSVKVEE